MRSIYFGVVAMVCWLVDGGGAMAVVRHHGLGLIVVVCCFSIMRALATRTQNIIDFIINKGTSNIFRCITKYIKNIFVLSWSAIEVCK